MRVVAATNVDLEKEVAEQRFRQDLYYRLSVVVIRVPPLRERRADIPLLVGQFLLERLQPRGPAASTSRPPALDALAAFDWPGNVRELENTDRAARPVQPRRGRSTSADLPPAFRGAPPGLDDQSVRRPAAARGDRAALPRPRPGERGRAIARKAAEVMGIDRRTLYRMAERFGLDSEGSAVTSVTAAAD